MKKNKTNKINEKKKAIFIPVQICNSNSGNKWKHSAVHSGQLKYWNLFVGVIFDIETLHYSNIERINIKLPNQLNWAIRIWIWMYFFFVFSENNDIYSLNGEDWTACVVAASVTFSHITFYCNEIRRLFITYPFVVSHRPRTHYSQINIIIFTNISTARAIKQNGW